MEAPHVVQSTTAHPMCLHAWATGQGVTLCAGWAMSWVQEGPGRPSWWSSQHWPSRRCCGRCIACILVEPHLQRALLHLYVDGSDAALWRSLRWLLTIVAVIELADGLQTVLGGVVQVRPATKPVLFQQHIASVNSGTLGSL